MRIFDLTLQLNHFPIRKGQQIIEQRLALSPEQYDKWLAQQLCNIVQYHLDNTEFYREITGKEQIENWNEVPIMQKSHFQRPLYDRLSKGFNEHNCFVNKTSGSSGNPMTFAKDRETHAIVWANIMRRFGWYGIDFNYSWQARFYGRTLDTVDGWKLKLKDYLGRRYRMDIFDLSDEAMSKILAKFKSTRFHYINGYTSSIVAFARYLQRQNLVLKDVCPSLQVCIVTSEMLFPTDRELLEKQLGVKVVNEYGASELEVIAFENLQGEWEVNSQTLFVEILDDTNQPVPYGQEGRIVVTSLDNIAHPFIRYEVGDRGALDERSTLQKPILKHLSGRTNDTAILPSGKRPAGMTFYSITKQLFEDDGNVQEFKIVQTQLDTFVVHYVSLEELSDREKERMIKVMTDYLEDGLHFEFVRETHLGRSLSGKLKQFECLLKA